MGCCTFVAPLERSRSSEDEPLYKFSEASAPMSPLLIIKSQRFVQERNGCLGASYTVGRKLGSGTYGEVYEATHISSGVKRAIKILDRNAIPAAELKAALCEVSLLKSLDHPNILKIFEVITETDAVNIVAELCDGGDLFQKLIDKEKLSERIAAQYMQQILSALAYCHERHIVHRDLKPENILIESNSPTALVKIIDFGISRKFDPACPLDDLVGTSFYVAPEVLSRNYSEKCDIWSCGVLLYYMLSGRKPFVAFQSRDVLLKVKEGTFSLSGPQWECISNEAKALVTLMLTKDPSSRPHARELLAHPWFSIGDKIAVFDSNMNVDIMHRLRNFNSDRLKLAALNFIASQLTSVQETEELRRKFIEMDENQDGLLSREEIVKGFSSLKLMEEVDVDEIMRVCDTDKSGFVDYSEFITATVNWQESLKEKQVEEAFRTFDQDHSGSIDLNELKAVFVKEKSELDENMWQMIMNDADEDRDGAISLQEFKRLMFRQKPKERRFRRKYARSF